MYIYEYMSIFVYMYIYIIFLGTIAVDSLAASAILGKNIFGDGAAVKGGKKGSKDDVGNLSKTLLWLSSIYGWSVPYVTIPVINASGAASLGECKINILVSMPLHAMIMRYISRSFKSF
jgi:hypothetical protein